LGQSRPNGQSSGRKQKERFEKKRTTTDQDEDLDLNLSLGSRQPDIGTSLVIYGLLTHSPGETYYRHLAASCIRDLQNGHIVCLDLNSKLTLCRYRQESKPLVESTEPQGMVCLFVGATYRPDFDLHSFIRYVGQSVQANCGDQCLELGSIIPSNSGKPGKMNPNKGTVFILEPAMGPAKLGQCSGRPWRLARLSEKASSSIGAICLLQLRVTPRRSSL
jgi:hypothetical protein